MYINKRRKNVFIHQRKFYIYNSFLCTIFATNIKIAKKYLTSDLQMGVSKYRNINYYNDDQQGWKIKIAYLTLITCYLQEIKLIE